MNSPDSWGERAERPFDRKGQLQGWLREAMPGRAFLLLDPQSEVSGSHESYDVLDIGMEPMGRVVAKGERFEKAEFLHAVVVLAARKKGLELGTVKSLSVVKKEALPLRLEMTEEVYRDLLVQGIRFEGQKMVTAGGFWLDLRPEENDLIRFVFDRMHQVEMIVVENATVGNGQILLYPFEEGELMTDKKRILPRPLGSAEESVTYLPAEVNEERLQELQALFDRHFGCETHQFRFGQPRKEADGYTESIGIYVTPEITGKEVYYNDVRPWDGSTSFTEEEFLLRARQALLALGVSFYSF